MAALLVVYFHSTEDLLKMDDNTWINTFNPFKTLVLQGQTAVSLFIVLSGYIFTSSAIGREILYRRFLLNRFLRIYPLMISILVVAIALHPDKFDLPDFVRTVLLFLKLPLLNYSLLDIQPWTATFWTIVPEFQFYLLFPVLLLLLNRSPRLIVALLAVTVLAKCFMAPFRDVSHLAYWTLGGRIDQFLIGMLLAHFLKRHGQPQAFVFALGLLLVLGGALLLNQVGGVHVQAWWQAFLPAAEGLAWSVFIAGYLEFGRRVPRFVSRVLVLIGTASFSMYLLHQTILDMIYSFLSSYLETDSIGGAAVITTVICLPFVLSVSATSFLLIENPFLKMRVKYLVPGKNRQVIRAETVPGAAMKSLGR